MNCDYCKKTLDVFPHKCKFCGKIHCSNHLLPENHKCEGLKSFEEKNEEWKEKFSNWHYQQKRFIPEEIREENLEEGKAVIIREEIKDKKQKSKRKRRSYIKINKKKLVNAILILMLIVFGIFLISKLANSEFLSEIKLDSSGLQKDESLLPKFFQNNTCEEIEQHAIRQEMNPAGYKKNFCEAICGQQNLEYKKYNCDDENKFHCFCKQPKNE
jgi:hypothetical protein